MVEIPQVLHVYMKGLQDHDVDAIASTLADDLKVLLPATTFGKPQFLTLLRTLYAGFPDWCYEHDAPEIRGDILAVKWRQAGTHTGPFAVPGGDIVPASGRSVRIPEHYFFYRVRAGKIIEIRPEPVPGGAPLGILEQIGARWSGAFPPS